jgi:gliding motility-associated-like protein
VEGDVEHSSDVIIPGETDNSGKIYVENNWLNNNVGPTENVFINSSPGDVVMFGVTQNIGGTTPTLFHDLILENISQKDLLVETWVEDSLDLTDTELRINNNIIHVRNPSVNSIQWNSGFISGDIIGGYIARSTNSNTPYMFPVGSTNLQHIYRAVEIIPSTADSSVYAVRLAGIDPDVDNSGTSFTSSTGPFSRTSLANNIYGVNDKFYHHVARFYTSNTNQVLNTKIFYFNSDEIFPYEFNGVSVWENPLFQWGIDNFGVNFPGALSSIAYPDKFMLGNISNFSNDIYALMVRDKITARVPQIFSPNGDGLNDFLHVLGYGLEKVVFIVYNRWGEKVFETTDPNIGWDGTFRGKEAQSGVYVYYMKAALSTSEIIEQSGDITLVR